MYSALPIKEQITQAILVNLQKIIAGATYQPGGAGATRTFQLSFAVERVILNAADAGKEDGNAVADLKVVLREGDDRQPAPFDNVEDAAAPIRDQGWLRGYIATIYLANNDPAIPFDQKKNVASAELLNGLLVDRQLGGLCNDIYPRGTIAFQDGADMPGIDVHFDVSYRTAENDAYAAG